jgi:hypothetical protein
VNRVHGVVVDRDAGRSAFMVGPDETGVRVRKEGGAWRRGQRDISCHRWP